MNRIRILIADDHALVRSGLRALLEAQPDMEVAGEADDGVTVIERCRQLKPDVVLLDLTMPGRGGISAAEELRHVCPKTKVLVLTMHEDAGYARLARNAGVAGYVLKRVLATELIKAIHAVHRGETYVTPSLAAAFHETACPPTTALSDREREVVTQIALGHTNTEIAGKLHISEKTIETHRAHIFEKLHLETRADLVRFALEHGFLKP
jgi:DNA-binding NarL/FixJ family response regulator